MHKSIDATDIELMIILQEKPVANDSTLARLTGLSSPTVKRRIDRLFDIQAIERIQAILNYDALDLRIVSIFLEIPNSNIDKVYSEIEKIDFLYYQIRCFGSKNGIHATFRIPNFAIHALQEGFTDLQSSGLINDFSFLSKITAEIRSKPRFIVYSTIDNTWDWSFSKWASISEDRLFRGINDIYVKAKTQETPSLKDLDLLDMEILSILSLNSRLKNVEILNSLSKKISPQRLSDRLRFLKKHFIKTYRVYLNWERIFHFLGFIFNCTCGEQEKKFFKVLLTYRPPPFETTFREHEHGFLLYAICPSSHMLELIKVLDSRVKKLEIYFLDYVSSKRYQLNPKAFIEKNKSWKTNTF